VFVKKWIILLVLIYSFTGCNRYSDEFTLQRGDLLFQDLDCGHYCDAIEKVTFGYNGAKFSHVGMVAELEDGNGTLVIEAVSKGVVFTPLDSFLLRSHDAEGNPKVVVGRLKPAFRQKLKEAINKATIKLGRPYDAVYDIEDDTYYCSELIYESFKTPQPLFEAAPMTFIDPDTGMTFPIWETYFAELGMAVPEGEPGINPGLISRSDKLEIVHKYGTPEGWQ